MFFRSFSPRSEKDASSLPRTWRRTRSEIRIPPGSAIASIRAELKRTELYGKTLGILGLGRIGLALAVRARAFRMNVLGWHPDVHFTEWAEICPTMQEVLRRSDFVTVHMKLGDRSRGLIGAAELALMRPDAFLINTSRAPIVDTAALVAALTERRIAGAALDVFDEEPLPPDDALPRPLRQVERLLLTPHIGYVTRQTYDVFYGETLEAILAFLAGAPIRVMEPS